MQRVIYGGAEGGKERGVVVVVVGTVALFEGGGRGVVVYFVWGRGECGV